MDRIVELTLYPDVRSKVNELVKTEAYQGFTYFITFNRLGIPCAYVEIPQSHELYEVDYENIELDAKYAPNWNLTFSGSQLHPQYTLNTGWFIGWDYGHCTDCVKPDFGGDFFNGRVWSTEEIEAECHKVIDALKGHHYGIEGQNGN